MSTINMTMRPASASHDLLLIERAESLALKLRDALQRKSFVMKSAATPEDATALAGELIRPILLFDCGSRSGTREYLSLFLEQQDLCRFPAIILGTEVEGLADELYGKFPLISTLRTPCSPNDLLECINYISERYRNTGGDSVAPPSAPSAKAAEKQSPETAHRRVTSTDDDEPSIAFDAYGEFDSVATLYFDQAKESALLSMNLGGGQYAKLGVTGLKSAQPWVSEDKDIASLISDLLARSGKWGKGHVLRVGFVADNILEALSIPSSILDDARSAARLLNLAVVERNQNYLRKEFVGRGSLLVKKELCSWLKDSALQLATLHRQPGISAVVATVARMIGREEHLRDDPTIIAASAILAAEILDRTCFQSGHWNPRAAHALLRRIATGKFRDLHPGALCALAKIISEALSSTAPAHLISRSMRNDAELLSRAQHNKDQIVAIHETKVSLDQLVPGMRLSQPLFAFDGRQLLEENLTLDQDLIWRIWQLSALRPINSPIVIVRKAEESAAQSIDSENDSLLETSSDS